MARMYRMYIPITQYEGQKNESWVEAKLFDLCKEFPSCYTVQKCQSCMFYRCCTFSFVYIEKHKWHSETWWKICVQKLLLRWHDIGNVREVDWKKTQITRHRIFQHPIMKVTLPIFLSLLLLIIINHIRNRSITLISTRVCGAAIVDTVYLRWIPTLR